jgi:hypothetical protein
MTGDEVDDYCDSVMGDEDDDEGDGATGDNDDGDGSRDLREKFKVKI